MPCAPTNLLPFPQKRDLHFYVLYVKLNNILYSYRVYVFCELGTNHQIAKYLIP